MNMKLKILAAAAALTPIAGACAQTEVAAPPPVEIPVVEYKTTWKCPGCTDNEKYVLQQLQEKTRISDRNALATIMGNIKQESKFIPNICEGGARVPYDRCYSGGYGLIQWTSLGRYNNLGKLQLVMVMIPPLLRVRQHT